jgi:hypothetical protein
MLLKKRGFLACESLSHSISLSISHSVNQSFSHSDALLLLHFLEARTETEELSSIPLPSG